MAGSEIQVYKKVSSTPEGECRAKKKATRVGKTEIIYGIFSFLLSRAMLFGQLCPFGISFFAASFSKERFLYGIAGVIFGALTAGVGVRILQYAVALGVLCLFELVLNKEKEFGPIWTATVAGIGNFAGCLAVLLFERFVIYNLLIGVVESILIGLVALLFENVYAIQSSTYEKLRIVNREEMFGVVILLGLSVYGLADVVDFGVVNFCEIIWSLLILSFAYVGGVTGGLGAGAMIGLIGAMSQSDPLGVIGLYSICGLAAGFAKKGGKIGVSAVYLLTAVGFGASTTVFAFGQAGMTNMLISSVLFALVPRAFYEKHFAFEGDFFTPMQQKAYSKRINALLVEKFQSLANTFQGLSDTVKNLSESKTENFSLNYAKVMDDAVEKVCASCSMRVYCWDKECEKTGRAFAGAVAKLKSKGYADALDFGEGFRKSCIHISSLTASMNHNYTMRRLNAVWDNQLNETRTLLGQQYKGFAGVMQEMSKEITQKVVCESGYKNKIKAGMENMGYSVSEIYLYEREDESYDAELHFDEITDEFSVRAVEKAVSAGMQRMMRVSVIDEYNCSVRLEPQYNFVVSSSIATLKKEGEEKNGDSYAVFNMRDNRCVLLLSDGMGSGHGACAESSSAVSLLKKLLTVGFDVDAAVHLVNSALVLKSGSESFATVDMAVIDLISGSAEFIKVGAARGYIKRESGVSTVRCAGLPVGILADTDVQKETHTLLDGDCIILVSDGVAEGKGTNGFVRYIESLPNGNTEEIAKKLLNYALSNRRGRADDDMTVIVAKIVENSKSEIV